MQPQLFSGARGEIRYKYTAADGSAREDVLAFVTDVSVSVQDGLLPTYVIGQLEPKSIEPLSIDVTCRIGRIVPIAQGVPQGATSAPADAALAKQNSMDHSFEFAINQILQKDAVEIVIKDKLTDKVIAAVKQARCSGRSTSVSSGDVARESYNFVGIFDAGYSDTNTGVETGYGFNSIE